jgi:glutamine amidotransferase
MDETFSQTARTATATCVVASVRSATPGTALGVSAAMPFLARGHLFAYNGALEGWPDATAPLAVGLGVRRLLRLDAVSDAALLWALVLARLDDGADIVDAVADVVAEAAATCGGRLNLLVTDGARVVATALGASLSYLEVHPGTTTGAVVASEPIDEDPGWRDVPDGSLVVATPTGVSVRRL